MPNIVLTFMRSECSLINTALKQGRDRLWSPWSKVSQSFKLKCYFEGCTMLCSQLCLNGYVNGFPRHKIYIQAQRGTCQGTRWILKCIGLGLDGSIYQCHCSQCGRKASWQNEGWNMTKVEVSFPLSLFWCCFNWAWNQSLVFRASPVAPYRVTNIQVWSGDFQELVIGL